MFLKAVVALVVIALVTACTSLLSGTPSGALPKNSAESEIFYKSVIVGGVAGAVVGGVIGHQADDKKGALIGGVVGAVIGNLIGREVAMQRIENLRNLRLEQDNLRVLLKSARSYNDKATEYNYDLEREIRQLKIRKSHSEGVQWQVKNKLYEAKKSHENIYATIEMRRKIAATLIPVQRRIVGLEIKKLQQVKRQMRSQIDVLIRSINEPVIPHLAPYPVPDPNPTHPIGERS